MKQPHAIVADDVRNVGAEYPHCARDAIEFTVAGFADTHFRRGVRPTLCQWVEQRLENGLSIRDDRWPESIAVGSLAFIDEVRSDLGSRPHIAMSSRIRWKLRAAGAGGGVRGQLAAETEALRS